MLNKAGGREGLVGVWGGCLGAGWEGLCISVYLREKIHTKQLSDASRSLKAFGAVF